MRFDTPCGGDNLNWVEQATDELSIAKKDCLDRCGLFHLEARDTVGICGNHFGHMYTNFVAHFASSRNCHYHNCLSSGYPLGKTSQMKGSLMPLERSKEFLQYCNKLIPKFAFVCSDCIPKIKADIEKAKTQAAANQGASSSGQSAPNTTTPPGSPTSSSHGVPGSPMDSQGSQGYRPSQNLLNSSDEEEDFELPEDGVERVYVYFGRDDNIDLIGNITEEFKISADFSERGIPKDSVLGN